MQATGYGTDGRQYRASLQLSLGAPDPTPVGNDVVQEFNDESGNSVADLTFDSVTQGGETTQSQVTLGPNAPRNFKIFKTQGQPQ